MAELKIRVGADVAPAIDGLRQLEGRMRTTTAAGQTFGKGLEQTTKSLQKLPQTSSAATQSLVNLSRVAQDAPFGFIGIANNINPLLESFQRLKVSTGTTGGAFKELGKSLIGPAGIGLAVGVVSSLLVVFGDKLFGTSKAAKEAKEANDKLAQGLANDIVKLTSIVAVIQNVNTSQGQRVKALQAVNEQYGKYLPSLGKEEISLKNIAESYDRIINSLLRQAVVKGLQEEIEKAVAKTASQLIGLEKEEAKRRAKVNEDNKAGKEQVKNYKTLEEQLSGYNKVVKDGNLALQSQSVEQLKAVKAVDNYEAALERLKGQLKRDLQPLIGIIGQFTFDDLDIKLGKPDKKEVDDYFFPIINTSLKVPIERIFDATNFRNVLLGIKPVTLDQLVTQKRGEDLFKNLVGNTGDAVLKKNNKTIEDLKNNLIQLGKIGLEVGNVFASAFDGLFQALVQGGNAIQAFGQAFIQALTGVISKLIQTAILAAIVSALGGGVGIGANSNKFGDIFKLLSGFGGFRAGGGPVEAGKTYAVGERGMELFTPSVSGRIIPNNQIGSVSTGGRSSGGGSVVLRGRELRLLGVRTTNSQIRLGVRA